MSQTLAAPAMTPASGMSVYFDADSASAHAAHDHGLVPNASTDTVTAKTDSSNTGGNYGTNNADVDRQPSAGATGGKKGFLGILKGKHSKAKMDDHDTTTAPTHSSANTVAAPATSGANGANAAPASDAKERKSVDFANTASENKSNNYRHSIGHGAAPDKQMQQRQTSAPNPTSEFASGGLFLPAAPPPITLDDDQKVATEPTSTTTGAQGSRFAEMPAAAAIGEKSQPTEGPVQGPIPVQGPAQGPVSQGQGHEQVAESEHKTKESSGAFAAGAALTGPAAQPGEDITHQQRTATAESAVSDGALAKITKAEKKDAKQLMKVIKSEGKVQKANLATALKELARLQKVQKQSSKDESRALSKHSKAASYEHKLHTRFLSAKAAHESALADLNAKVEQLDMSRKHAQHETEELSKKTREVETLRRQKAVDDREREVKLQQLTGQGRK